MQNKIEKLFLKDTFSEDDYKIFDEFKNNLETGKIRSAEKIKERWQVNKWVKKGILLGFKMGKIKEYSLSSQYHFTDKDTYGVQTFSASQKIRLVPGGSSVREGAFIAVGVTMMPPMYVNVGAYVDSGSMIDSHALVGSCAQIGKNVHLSAGAMIGGVIEPIGAKPVIIEDDVFIGGNCGIYEGVIIKKSAIIAAGTIITSGTKIYDAVNQKYISSDCESGIVIPEKAVVVSGTRPLKTNPEFNVYCPIIIKYRDEKSDTSTTLEQLVR